MKFDLKAPCSDCPFRKDVRPYLTPARAKEIAGVLLGDQSFSCHKTTTAKGKTNTDANARHCAGALVMLERADRPNQGMRIAERLGLYDRHALDMAAPVYEDFHSFIQAQKAGQPSKTMGKNEETEKNSLL